MVWYWLEFLVSSIRTHLFVFNSYLMHQTYLGQVLLLNLFGFADKPSTGINLIEFIIKTSYPKENDFK